MSPAEQSLLKEWSPPLALDLLIILAVFVYIRGWIRFQQSARGLVPPWRLAAFLAGMFFLWVAIGSPLSAFDESSLTIHMVQHILLMLVVPPLVLVGSPALPFCTAYLSGSFVCHLGLSFAINPYGLRKGPGSSAGVLDIGRGRLDCLACPVGIRTRSPI